MPSLSPKDRVSLCQFTFSDGRRCRTPRTGKNPHFCFDHAAKEARAHAADNLGKDLAYFFSGDYLSACDLSTALGRLIPAVLRGDVKPRTARTVAYLAQTLLQTIHISQHEYCEAFDAGTWRKSIRSSVNDNYNHRFPQASKPQPAPVPKRTASPQPQPQPASPPTPAQQPVEPPANCDSDAAAQAFRPEESFSSNSSLATHHSFTPSEAERPLPPAPSPHTPLPPTSAEFAEQLLAGLPRSGRPGPTGETGGSQAPQPTPVPTPAPQSKIPTLSGPTPSPHTTANLPSAPATQSALPSVPTPSSAGPEQGQSVDPPPRPTTEPNREAPWWDSRHLYDPPDSHLL